MKTILYQSQGASEKQMKDLKIGICASPILAVLSFFQAFSLRNPVSFGGDLTLYTISDKKMFNFFIILAFLFSITTVLCMAVKNRYKSCWVKVYDNYLEAQTIKSILRIEISNIDYVQIDKLNLFVTAHGKIEKISCEDPEKLYRLLNELISQSKNVIQV